MPDQALARHRLDAVSFYPFMVGLGLLMPLDFLFSSWFFYLSWKLQAVVVVANAWDADPRMPYANYQAFGAYFLFFARTLWISRHYFGQVVARALGRPRRWTMRTSRCATAGPSSAWRAGWPGWSPSRRAGPVAVAGDPVLPDLLRPGPGDHADAGGTGDARPRPALHRPGLGAVGRAGDAGAWRRASLAAFSLFFWFNRAYRCHPMPFQLEAFKMAEQTGARREMRAWFWALLLAGGFGMLCAFWALLHNDYISAAMKWNDTAAGTATRAG